MAAGEPALLLGLFAGQQHQGTVACRTACLVLNAPLPNSVVEGQRPWLGLPKAPGKSQAVWWGEQGYPLLDPLWAVLQERAVLGHSGSLICRAAVSQGLGQGLGYWLLA